MSIERIVIPREQVASILSQKESHFLDIKSKDISPANLTKTICAFANASGGELYVGIDEKDSNEGKTLEWRGFADEEAANGHLQAFETFFPLGQEYAYTFLAAPDLPGLVLQVNVSKSRDIRNASNGKIYIRRGAQNLPIETEEQLRRLRYDKGVQSFETETVDADIATISQSNVTANFLRYVVPTTEPEPWFRKQQLIRSDKPTVAGILLFADIPQAILPKRCGIKIYRYTTTAPEGTRETLAFNPITIEGHLYDQIKQAVQITIELIEKIKKFTAQGTEEINYPLVTLHEIITNALLHRDYSITADAHVRIFDNRVEVENPGKLPGHVNTENYLREQFARNGAIVRLINKFPDPPNKDVGEGLRTAFAAMRKMKLQSPELVEREHAVVVYIRHEPLPVVDGVIMEYLDTHEEVTNQTIRELSGITSEREVRQAFYRLRKAGLIEIIPERARSKRAWRKTS